MSTRELTCIGCPLGCAITVTMDGSTVTAVTGFYFNFRCIYKHIFLRNSFAVQNYQYKCKDFQTCLLLV